MNNINELEVFSKRLAEFLIANGFDVIRTRRDTVHPNYWVWVFEKSDALNNAIRMYDERKKRNINNIEDRKLR